MDLDALREALAYLDGELIDCPVDDPIEFVVAAARAVLDSEEAWLCEEHKRLGNRNACPGRARVEACPMEPVAVVRIRLLAEEGT